MDFHHVNRIETEALEWNSKEERLRKLFKSSPLIEKSLLKEKLKWCENMLVKYRKNNHFEERSALQIIKNERSNLIKLVYPSTFGQIFYKLMNLLILEKVNAKILISDELKSNRSLEVKLKQAGFNDALNKVERYMRLGQTKFTVPVSYYLNEKERIDHALQFKKDELGYYHFEGFRTSLHDKSKPSENRQHYFSADDVSIFNAKQSYDLLSGRAVLTDGTWKQFDLNDKDADSSYRIKEFPENYGYNIEKALSQLPLKISDQLEFTSLIISLKEGRREEAVLLKDGVEQKVFIEANPQYKSVNIYNESLKKNDVRRCRGHRKERSCKSAKKQSGITAPKNHHR
ncbi:hypothetical protein [Flavobacterium chryseum]|uniref:hypothetical protein n=1 Tax=Flavobacterium sp. P3160 TaxID=2512113 RepID=UPI001061E0CE|nr:hypothetical protein [Flavobacterium sp. P3160]